MSERRYPVYSLKFVLAILEALEIHESIPKMINSGLGLERAQKICLVFADQAHNFALA